MDSVFGEIYFCLDEGLRISNYDVYEDINYGCLDDNWPNNSS